MRYQFYFWLYISFLVLIGILQFFDLSSIYNYILLGFAIISGVMYFRLKFRKEN